MFWVFFQNAISLSRKEIYYFINQENEFNEITLCLTDGLTRHSSGCCFTEFLPNYVEVEHTEVLMKTVRLGNQESPTEIVYLHWQL